VILLTKGKGKVGKKATSQRTAVIRVSAINTTNQGRVEYSLTDIEKVLVNWSKSASFTYWLIEHDEREEDEEAEERENSNVTDEVTKEGNVHFHVVIDFENPMPFINIKNKFPYGHINPARNMKLAIQYLVHLNDKSKKQYSWDSILTNGELEQYKQVDEGITLKSIIEQIDAGTITEFNYHEKISMEMYVFYQQKINSAFKYYREREFVNKNRDIDVILMVGEAGTGKTSFAKRYCEKTNSTYCISSASNDSIQDYKGEKVLILDDLRDDAFPFHDLLKTLDNHTNSSVKSRYINKMFFGKTIIITSTVPIEDWYKDLKKEDKKQLFRRIRIKYLFDNDWINIFEYDERKGYVLIGRTENIITLEDRRRKAQAMKVFEDMGLKIEKVKPDEFVTEQIRPHEPVDNMYQTKFE
jgi:hypothetical protein